MNPLREILESVVIRDGNKYMARSGTYYKYSMDGGDRKEISESEYISAISNGKATSSRGPSKTYPKTPPKKVRKPWSPDKIKYEVKNENSRDKEYALKMVYDGYKRGGFGSIEEAYESNKKIGQKFIDKSHFGIRIHAGAFKKVLDEGRFKSQFETKSSNGMFNPYKRGVVEKELMNVPEDIDPQDRPIYGLMVPEGFRKGFDMGDFYGDIVVILKKEDLYDRTTITFGDSLDARGLVLPSKVTDLEECSMPNLIEKEKADKFRNLEDFCLSYAELQYHGQLKVEDIECVHFQSGARWEITHKLAEMGIPWTEERE